MGKAIPDSYEIRDSFVPLDTRATDEVDTFSGHANVAWVLDYHGTAFASGAAKKTLAERTDPFPVLWSHDTDKPIAYSLAAREDKRGLSTESKVIVGTAAGADAMALLRSPLPLGLSIGFRTLQDRAGKPTDPIDFSQHPGREGEHEHVRVITEYELYEWSPVVFPSNKQSRPSNVRAEVMIDLLPSLLDDLRAGRLSDDQLAIIDQFVAARQEAAPDPHGAPRTSEVEARRNRDAEMAFLFADLGYPWEQIA